MLNKLLTRTRGAHTAPLTMVNLSTIGEFKDEDARRQFQERVQGMYCGARKICYNGRIGSGITFWSGIPTYTGKFDVSNYRAKSHVLPLQLLDSEGNLVVQANTGYDNNKLYVGPEIVSYFQELSGRERDLEELIQQTN